MNPRHVLLSVCVVLAAALCAPVLSATEAAAPVVLSVKKVTGEAALIERGATPRMVQAALGEPYRRLSSDIHLFSGYHAEPPASEKLGCDVLVITYTDGKVSDLQLVNRTALKVIAAHLRSDQPAKIVAESK